MVRLYNNLQDRGDCQTTRKSYKTSHIVGWNRKLLRDVRLLDLQSFAELIHAFLSSRRQSKFHILLSLGEGLEELGFGVGELL